MIQTQNYVTRLISRLDSIMNELINENEESLSCQPLTNSYILNSTDWTQKSYYFGNQDSILELDQTLSYESRLEILASYPFSEFEIKHECDPESYVGDSISLFDSMMTPVSLPDFFSLFPSQH